MRLSKLPTFVKKGPVTDYLEYLADVAGLVYLELLLECESGWRKCNELEYVETKSCWPAHLLTWKKFSFLIVCRSTFYFSPPVSIIIRRLDT